MNCIENETQETEIVLLIQKEALVEINQQTQHETPKYVVNFD